MNRQNQSISTPRVELRLEGAQLEPFRQAWAAHRRNSDDNGMLLASAESYSAIDPEQLPPFVRERLNAIPDIIALISDHDWQANAETRRDLLAALCYFVDPNDLIPDQQPRYGLLDDALVIDIALDAQRHEWLAWQEFDEFRRDLRAHGDSQQLSRAEWMTAREQLLAARIRRRSTGGFVSNGFSDSFHRESHSYVGGGHGDEPFGVH